jgi:hypothetical protein
MGRTDSIHQLYVGIEVFYPPSRLVTVLYMLYMLINYLFIWT